LVSLLPEGEAAPGGAVEKPPGAVTPPPRSGPLAKTGPDTSVTHRGCTRNEFGDGLSQNDQEPSPTVKTGIAIGVDNLSRRGHPEEEIPVISGGG